MWAEWNLCILQCVHARRTEPWKELQYTDIRINAINRNQSYRTSSTFLPKTSRYNCSRSTVISRPTSCWSCRHVRRNRLPHRDNRRRWGSGREWRCRCLYGYTRADSRLFRRTRDGGRAPPRRMVLWNPICWGAHSPSVGGDGSDQREKVHCIIGTVYWRYSTGWN